MFRKATFALAGMLAMVAAAAIPTTAGAADTALVDNITLYEEPAFNTLEGDGTQDAIAGACQPVSLSDGSAQAKSAELPNIEPTLRVQLFSDTDCGEAVGGTSLITELNAANRKDAGGTWIAPAKSFKKV